MPGAPNERLRAYASDVAVGMAARDEAVLQVAGTLAVVDISGFTRLTERLAAVGREGAEQLTEILNGCFEQIIGSLGAHGGDVVKFGGDAVLALFDGDDHADRAIAASVRIQQWLRSSPAVRAPRGPVRLGASIGVEAGVVQLLLTRGAQREILVVGATATAVARLEHECRTGAVLVGPGAAGQADAHRLTRSGTGFVVRLAPPARALAARPLVSVTGDVSSLVPPDVARVVSGQDPNEHRRVVSAFVRIEPLDRVVAEDGAEAALVRIESVVDALIEAGAELEVCLCNSDVIADGVKLLVTAGAPTTHEDDDMRAVLVIRRALERCAVAGVKSGIARGPAFAGDIGTAARRCYTVQGDSVNLAARLAELARPGEILVHSDVGERIDNHFELSDVELVSLRGKQRAVRAQRVGALRAQRPADRHDTGTFVGRTDELARLHAATRDVADGAGRVIEIVGEAGAGKSQLLGQLRPIGVLVQSTGELHLQGTPFAAAIPFVRAIVVIPNDADAGAAGQLLRERVRERAPELLPLLPLIAIPARADVAATEEADAIAVDFRRERLLDATAALLVAFIEPGTCITIDDAHLLDEASASLFARLAADAEQNGWLIVSARRPEGAGLMNTGGRLDLGALDGADARDLALTLLADQPVADAQLEEIVHRSGGNPLFLRELCRTRAHTPGELPESVELVIASRIDRLAPAHRDLLRCASVLGNEIDPAVVADVLERDEAFSAAAAGPLGDFITPTPGGRLRFVHDLVRATAYEGLPRARRARLHARVASTLERFDDDATYWPQLSHHYFAADAHESALHWSLLAGDDARERTALTEAAALYDTALACARRLAQPVDVARAAESRAEMCERLGHPEEAAARYAEAHRNATDEITRARLVGRRANVLTQIGRYPVALRVLTIGLAELGDGDDGATAFARGKLLLDRAAVWIAQGKYRQAAALLERVADDALAHDDKLLAARAWMHLEMTLDSAGDPRGREFGERALPVMEAHDAWFDVANLSLNLGVTAMDAGDLPEAVELFDKAAALHERVGHVLARAVVEVNLGAIELDRGELDAAGRTYAHVRRVFRAAGHEIADTVVSQQLGRLAARRGEHGAAAGHLAEAEQRFRALGTDDLSEVHVYQVEALALAGEGERARTLADQIASEVAHLDATESLPLTFRRVCAIAAYHSGATEVAISELMRILDDARALARRLEVVLCLHALAEIFAAIGREPLPEWARERAELTRALGIVWVPPLRTVTSS